MTQETVKFREAVDVSRETAARLSTYAALLAKWNPAINLVSKASLADLWTRHFADSAQVLALADNSPASWVDLGSGGGFPGMVVAILAAETRPELRVTCVESDRRKASFLQSVARETGVAVKVLAERAEQCPPMNADVVSARALASLPELIGLAVRHLAPDGLGLFLKGTGHPAEVAAALENWAFRLDTIESRTEPGSAILKIRSIRRA